MDRMIFKELIYFNLTKIRKACKDKLINSNFRYHI